MIHKVLLATMSLDIGGAETHIVELALELKRRGIDVHIASNGGVYVADLEKASIPHHSVPMDRRSISCMLTSLIRMRRLIKTIKPDIVHAHARIPGFLCGLLRKTMRFNFVTTAHFDFAVSHGLRYLTNWGLRVIAVSEDIKRYLISNYHIKPSSVFVTINGIDTNKFSPDTPPGDIFEQLGLDPARPIICNVSRLDENAALVSRRLIEIAPELNRRLPGIQLLIVGDGDIYSELKTKADAVNDETGLNTVTLTGSRTDINVILTVCDLFVGVSRSALEALCVSKPSVIAGNEGFLGLFTPDKLQIAYDTNFTCRGCEESSQDLLLCEITRFFNIPKSQRDELGAFGRSLILSDYSVRKMTDDCLHAYNSVSGHKYNILLSGYYGYKNAGDEAILLSIHNSISNTFDDASITVLSYDPEDTMARYGCRAVDRFKILAVARAIKKCDVLVSGGGSLLQDYTSTRSLLYYLFIIRAAKLLGKKVMIYANGIGPVRKSINRRRVKSVVSRADVITLRDATSLSELRAMGVLRDDMHVTADPVFTLRGIPRGDAVKILGNLGIPDKPFVTVSIRDWPNMGDFCRSIASVCDSIYSEHGRNILFISMQSNRDIAISHKVRSFMKNPSFVLEERLTAGELMGIIGAGDAVIAMRLHALIFAAGMCVPFAGLVYDPKVLAYTEMLSMPSAGNVTSFDSETALSAVRLLFDNHEQYTGSLREKSAQLEKSAQSNTQYLSELLTRADNL